MKGSYPKELFWMGLITTFLFRHFYLLIPAIVLLIIGIWVKGCLIAGAAVLLADAVWSVIDQLKIRDACVTSESPQFAPFQKAVLSDNWRENLKEVMDNPKKQNDSSDQ